MEKKIQANSDNNRKYLDGLYGDKEKDKKKKDDISFNDAINEKVEEDGKLQYFTE